MDIFSVLTLGGGLAFFLFGMHVMSGQLEKLAGGRLEKALATLTSNPISALLLGCGVTIAIQSSSALTVMLVGFVNSGILHLNQTIWVVFGSNIGTTFTAWILSLSGIGNESVLLQLLKPSSFSPVIALVGAIMIIVCKSPKKKNIAEIMLGFSVLMYGMQLMSQSVEPLAESPQFASLLLMFKSPVIAIIISALFTAIIQSSAATIGILQALSTTGAITYGMSIPLVMGLNIGTCITAVLSAISSNRDGKRVAVLHLSIKIIGTVIVSALFYSLNAIFRFAFTDRVIGHVGLAVLHTIFNIITTLLLAPYTRRLEKMAYRLVPAKGDTARPEIFIDERLLATPSFAISECRKLTDEMARLTKQAFLDAMSLLDQYDDEVAARVLRLESLADQYEDKLGSYLVKISGKSLTESDSASVAELLHAIGDFERISDHAVNVLRAAEEMHNKEISFSPVAVSELSVLAEAIREILDMTVEAFLTSNLTLAARVEPLEQVIDDLQIEIKANHIQRLQDGRCTIELGFILSDVLNNYERVSDHCSNIAVCVIKIMKDASFDTHAYLSAIKTGSSPQFLRDFETYKQKYTLPA